MTDTAPAFFGRRSTLEALARHRSFVEQTGTGRIVAVRGRRQVGKSTVVEKFVEIGPHPYAFVSGIYQAPVPVQLAAATRALEESRHPVADVHLLTQSPAASWSEWLGRLAIAARTGPVVAVLDEFPWMTAQGTLEGELQATWDRTLQKLPVLLILVGSDVAMMDDLASHGRPLFGRISPLVVSALDPAEVAQAYSGRDATAAFDAYLVTGGYPRLVTDLVRTSGDVTDYVRGALQDEFSPLVTTGRLTMDAEFAEPQYAYQVLSAIGSSDTANPGFMDVLGTLSDPAERSNAQTATTRALATLTGDRRLIERESPAWAPPSSKLRRYRITDPYLRFWFRYVERNVDRIARGRSDLAVAAFDRDWATWRGQSIEPVVRQSLHLLSRADERLADVESVLPWWTRASDVEVDVVAATRTATALVGTITWRARGGVTAAEIAQVRRQRELIPHAEAAVVAAISPTGTAAEGADLTFDATDLLSAWA